MSSKISTLNANGKKLSVINSDLLDKNKNVVYLDTVDQATNYVGQDGDVIHISDKDRGGVFTYNSNAVHNDGTVLGHCERQYSDNIDVKWFGAKGDGITDDTNAIQNAIDTGFNVYLPEGTYIISDEILIITEEQKIYGDGGGSIDTHYNPYYKTRILGKGTFSKYRKTRRLAPETSTDPDDKPLSCMINIENINCTIEDIFIDLYCDYTDNSITNLGSDCDIGIFNGCRTNLEIRNVSVHGYFRVASIYLDVTRSTGIFPEFTSPKGITYPIGDGVSGSDRIKLSSVNTLGGFKGIFLAGALNSSSGNYYDYLSGNTFTAQGGRGGSGDSDFLIDENSYIQGRDHHSGARGYDATGTTNTDNIDDITACLAIDGRRGSTSQGRIRRIRVQNSRLKTIEAIRIFIDRAYEVSIDWVHTEPATFLYDATGKSSGDSGFNSENYGPIACKPTDGVYNGTDQVMVRNLLGSGALDSKFQNLLDNWSYIKFDDNVNFNHYSTDAYLNLVTVTTDISSTNIKKIGQLTVASIYCEYSSLDTSDVSKIAFKTPLVESDISSLDTVSVSINYAASSGLVTTSTEKLIAVPVLVSGDLHLNFSLDGTTMEKYNGGKILDSGKISVLITLVN